MTLKRFNVTPVVKHRYAQKMAEIVSKMEDEEADTFTFLVMAEVLHNDLEKNHVQLQKRLDEVVEWRLERVKKATKTLVSKSDNADDWEFARAVGEFEEIAKAKNGKGGTNPYILGNYSFDESDFRRDPRTGRFMVKVRPTANAKPLKDHQAQAMLRIDTKDKTYKGLDDETKAKFQNEYMQVVNFLNIANQMGSGTKTAVQVADEETGMRYWKELNGKLAASDYQPKTERVVAVEARPGGFEHLTLGGAAFGLQPALSGQAVESINTADAKFNQFSEDWVRPQGSFKNNEPLYNRVKTTSAFLGAIAPPTSNVRMAAKFGEKVGEHGPQAEEIIGPAARKTAYRYRGIEKTPDQDLLEAYKNATKSQTLLRSEQRRVGADPTRLSPDEVKRRNAYVRTKVNEAREAKNFALAEAQGQTIYRAGEKFDPESGQMQRTSNIPDVDLTDQEFANVKNKATQEWNAKRLEVLRGRPTEEQTISGREVLINYLNDRERRPNRDLYNLQLKSGVTPPSEGFLLDDEGNIVSQSVGYGDDHYLPFNLRKLGKLRGGEYVRSRSVGGPTSEDIYTGLMMGARRVTVTSRSGTFTVEFDETFKGKRRYNDKALRMTRRYEHLLDTVKEGKVERNQQISPEVRAFLQAEVDKEFAWADRPTRRAEMKNAIEAYKSELAMTGEDEAEFDQFFREVSADMSTEEKTALRAQMHNDWRSQNEFYFTLNGAGYRDALQALSEQFPYYIKSYYRPRREAGRIETEQDKGYVEPGRNRPNAADAGWYATGTKYSAKYADFQRARGQSKQQSAEQAAEAQANGTTEGDKSGETTSLAGGGKITPVSDPNAEILDRAMDRGDEADYATVALTLRNKIGVIPEGYRENHPVVNLSDNDFIERMKSPDGRREYEAFVKAAASDLQTKLGPQYKAFLEAMGNVDRTNFTEAASDRMGERPFRFPDIATTKKSAKRQQVEQHLTKIDRQHPAVSTNKFYSEMTEAEMRTELDGLLKIKSSREDIGRIQGAGRGQLFSGLGLEPKSTTLQLATAGDRAIQERINALHLARTLKANLARKPVKAPEKTAELTQSTPAPTKKLPTRGTEENPIEIGTKAGTAKLTDTDKRSALEKMKDELIVEQMSSDMEDDEDAIADITVVLDGIKDALKPERAVSDEIYDAALADYKRLMKKDFGD